MSLLTAIKSLFGFKSGGAGSPDDRFLVCEDCNKKFVFDAGEQRFFKAKGFTDPKRCPDCRKNVRSHMRKRRGGKHFRKGNHQHHRRERGLIDGDSPYADER